jgi:hypothetical protein
LKIPFGNVSEGFMNYICIFKAFGVILLHFEMDFMHQGGPLKIFFLMPVKFISGGQGFMQWGDGGNLNLTWGSPPHQLDFLGNFISGFENLITLTNIKCNFKAIRSRIKHFKVLKTHQGGYFRPPLIFFWRKPQW